MPFVMCGHRNITAVAQHVGTDSDWCKTGRKIMLDKEYMVLPRSSITAQDGIAEFVGQILGEEGERRPLRSRNAKCNSIFQCTAKWTCPAGLTTARK